MTTVRHKLARAWMDRNNGMERGTRNKCHLAVRWRTRHALSRLRAQRGAAAGMPTRVQVLHPAGDVNEDAKAQAQAHGKGLVMQQVVERPVLRARAPGPTRAFPCRGGSGGVRGRLANGAEGILKRGVQMLHYGRRGARAAELVRTSISSITTIRWPASTTAPGSPTPRPLVSLL